MSSLPQKGRVYRRRHCSNEECKKRISTLEIVAPVVRQVKLPSVEQVTVLIMYPPNKVGPDGIPLDVDQPSE